MARGSVTWKKEPDVTIPSIIHYCWFGSKDIPLEHQESIRGWRRLHPNYEFMFWNDETFASRLSGTDSEFVKECQKRNLPGFLSDFLRFTVLNEYGGIYLDTDVEIFKPFDTFRDCDMFLGYIFDSLVGTAIIGSKKENPIIQGMLQRLEADFCRLGRLTVSNNWVTAFLLENCDDFLLCGQRQSLKCGIEIYPKDYFERYCLNPHLGGGYSEHHCYGSWYNRKKSPLKSLIKFLVGRGLVSQVGHYRANRGTPFYKRHKHDLETWMQMKRPVGR